MKKKYHIGKVWCFLLLSFLLLIPAKAVFAQKTMIQTEVPSIHHISVNCGTGGSFLQEGVRWQKDTIFSVSRLSEFTLTVLPEDGYQLEAAWCEGQPLYISGSKMTISQVYADAVIFLRFGKKSEQEGNGAETTKATETGAEAAKAESIVIDAKGNPMPYRQEVWQKEEKSAPILIIRALPEQLKSGEYHLDSSGNQIYAKRTLLLNKALLKSWKEQAYGEIWFTVKDAVLILSTKDLQLASYRITLVPLEYPKALTDKERKLLLDFKPVGSLYDVGIVMETEEGVKQEAQEAKGIDYRIRILYKEELTKKEKQSMKLLLISGKMEKSGKQNLVKPKTKYIDSEAAADWIEKLLQMDESISEEEFLQIQEKTSCFEAKLSASGKVILVN